MSVDENLWYVKLADGDVERVTLDQLDEAFQKGQIDENSMVLAAGSEQWMKLAELLGLSEGAAPPAAAPPPPAQPVAASPRPVPVAGPSHSLAPAYTPIIRTPPQTH